MPQGKVEPCWRLEDREQHEAQQGPLVAHLNNLGSEMPRLQKVRPAAAESQASAQTSVQGFWLSFNTFPLWL